MSPVSRLTPVDAKHLVDLVIAARATVPATFTRPCRETLAKDTAAFTAVLDAVQAVTR